MTPDTACPAAPTVRRGAAHAPGDRPNRPAEPAQYGRPGAWARGGPAAYARAARGAHSRPGRRGAGQRSRGGTAGAAPAAQSG